MNKLLLILSAIFLTLGVIAQVPEKMSYQAVVRNGKKELIANRQIGLRISIIKGTVNGVAIYQEVFKPNPVTNANGLVTAIIGSGTPILGTFSSINWANGPYFIQAETDTTGGTNYTIAGTTQLLSVPYALHAKTAESTTGTITETDPVFAAWDKDYNDITNKPDLSVYATKEMVNQGNNTSIDYNDIINKPDLSVYATKDMINQNPASLDYNNLINKPDLTVFATKDMINQNTSNPDYNELNNKPDLSIYATKNMANQNITNLANPVNHQDAATKAYVDALLKRIEKLETDKLLEEGFIDKRDGNHYKVVQIGSQIWMAENLKYLPVVDGPPDQWAIAGTDTWSITEPKYYVFYFYGKNVNEAKATNNYNKYGVLYNWNAAMNGATPSNTNPSRVQGVCPTGWHLPSRNEWDQLVDYLGGDSIAGGKLKETGTPLWNSPNTGATNESGFSALPGGGFMYYDGFKFWNSGFYSIWWSASWDNINPVNNFFILSWELGSVEYWDWWWKNTPSDKLKGHGLSVRCVKD